MGSGAEGLNIMGRQKNGSKTIPEKIVEVLTATPGEFVFYDALFMLCWGLPYKRKYCNPTIYANVCKARKLLAKGRIENYCGVGYIYYEE